MTNRQLKAYNAFKSGYGCGSAVALAFSDLIDLPDKRVAQLTIAMGGGFSRTRTLCGAVAAMGLVYGADKGKDSGDIHGDKTQAYKDVYEMCEAFKAKNGSIECNQLLKDVKGLTQGYKPDVRDEHYYKVRPCVKFVLDAVEILESSLKCSDILPE
ncbi:MAG: C-GCAxxG-C-C family protein [Clostridia bacterium]|nr:C-GCAxxG-C-C family protein [Clostridia bacterium]